MFEHFTGDVTLVGLRRLVSVGPYAFSDFRGRLVLRGPFPATDTVPARDLWAEQPCLVFVVRRMG